MTQIKIFTIPLGAENGAEEELNLFLKSHKVVDIKREMAMVNGSSSWSFCISYLPLGRSGDPSARNVSSSKVDYREVLQPEEFKRFSLYRKVRKEIADKDAVPAYAVFTDAELAAIAKMETVTLAQMSKIDGIGAKRCEKYGSYFCNLNLDNEEGGVSKGEDCKS